MRNTSAKNRASKVFKVTAVIVPSLLLLLSMSGCDIFKEPRYPSPVSGQELTWNELQAEQARETRRIEQQKIQSEADSKAALLKAQSQLRIDTARLESSGRIERTEIEERYQQTTGEIVADSVSDAERYREEKRYIDEQYQSAFDAIGSAYEQRGSVVNAVLGTVKEIPGSSGVPGLTPLMSLAAILFGADSYAQRRRRAGVERAAARIVDSIDIVRGRDPQFDEAFERNSVVIKDWQGGAGSALVAKIRSDNE